MHPPNDHVLLSSYICKTATVYSQTVRRLTGWILFNETPPMNEEELNSPPILSVAKTPVCTPNNMFNFRECQSSRRVVFASVLLQTAGLILRLGRYYLTCEFLPTTGCLAH